MKSIRVALFLVRRAVTRGNYAIAALTILMVMLIYTSLLFLPSLIQGAINLVNYQLVHTVTSDIVITPSSKALSIDDASAYLAQIRSTTGVAQATAVNHVGNQISSGSTTGVWTVEAIDPASYAEVFTTPANIFEGRYLAPNDGDQVFLGIGIAGADQTDITGYRSSLQTVHANDQVSITLTSGQVRTFNVVGIYNNHFALSDNHAYVTMNEAEQFDPGITNHASAIYIRLNDGANVDEVESSLANIRGDVRLETSSDLSSAVGDQLAAFRLISNILKVVSLLMAAITIFIVTYIDLVNRRRQIGIQRAIGIRSSAIVLSYVLKALTYAATGIILGFILFRFVITPVVRSHPFHFPNGPVSLSTTSGEVTRDVTILIVVAMVGALIPAIQSIRLRMVDAIWGR